MLIAIAVVSENWGIGKEEKLLFRIPEDTEYFRTMTDAGSVIMGRKTLESLPGGRPLKGRNNIILTRNKNFNVAGTMAFNDIPSLLEYINGGHAFVIGGGEVYKALLPYCEKALITKVHSAPEADTYFPNLDEDEKWEIANSSDLLNNGNCTFQFMEYAKK